MKTGKHRDPVSKADSESNPQIDPYSETEFRIETKSGIGNAKSILMR